MIEYRKKFLTLALVIALIASLSLACCAVSQPYQNASTVLNSTWIGGSITHQVGMREDRDVHIENNQLLKGLSEQNASPIFDHVVFGSRPDVVAGSGFVPEASKNS